MPSHPASAEASLGKPGLKPWRRMQTMDKDQTRDDAGCDPGHSDAVLDLGELLALLGHAGNPDAVLEGWLDRLVRP